MMTSVLQKFLTLKFKDNVTIQYKQMVLEFSISSIGILFIIMYANTNYNTLIEENCGMVMEFTADDI